MDELIQAVFEYLMTTQYGQYAVFAAMVCYGLTHVVAVLPPKVTSKIPNWVMIIVSAIAGNYRHGENLKTDKRGNDR